MDAVILPNNAPKKIHQQTLSDGSIFGTTAGATKSLNEDRIGYIQTEQSLRMCVTDGHWGEAAADRIAKYWLDESVRFPSNTHQAIEMTQTVEKQLYDDFGSLARDEEKDRTPEAAFAAVELSGNNLCIVSYGDCRLLVVRQGEIRYQLPTKATWLGAFSYSGLRDRQSVRSALVFESVSLQHGDIIVLFTDGIDECIYEVSTISFSTLAEYCSAYSPAEAFDKVMSEVFAFGAEDNASLAVLMYDQSSSASSTSMPSGPLK